MFFGFINMNDRLYDPITGRMLSPDPYIMDPACSQDYNRYTYARNNLLIYIDPSGESLKDWWRKIFGKSEGNSNVAKEHMSDGGGGMGGYEGAWSNYNYNSGDYYNLSGVDISGNSPSQPLPDYSIMNNWDYWFNWNYVYRYYEGNGDFGGATQPSGTDLAHGVLDSWGGLGTGMAKVGGSFGITKNGDLIHYAVNSKTGQ